MYYFSLVGVYYDNQIWDIDFKKDPGRALEWEKTCLFSLG
jgi:hypothetical protein